MKQLRILTVFLGFFCAFHPQARSADTTHEDTGQHDTAAIVHVRTGRLPAKADEHDAVRGTLSDDASGLPLTPVEGAWLARLRALHYGAHPTAPASWREVARKAGPAGAAVLGLLLLVSYAYVRLRRETQRRERTEEQLADVTRNMPAVVYRFRFYDDGRIAFIYVGGNPEPMFGVPADTFLHDERRAFARIDARDQAGLMTEVIRAAASMTPIHAEMRMRDIVPERWIASHAVPRRVSRAVEFTGYWIDVSEQRLQSVHLAAAKEAAESATRAKSQFLATMSHEIRTPMHGLIGMLEMLRSTPLDAAQRQWLGTAETSAEALLQILDDVLDFSRIEAGKLAIEKGPIDLRELVVSAVELFAWQADRKGLLIEHRIDTRLAQKVLTDGARLRQILLNLVSNAIKFTERGIVTVAIDVMRTGEGRQRLRITVADTGIGIAANELVRLFTPFAQAESSITRRFGGSGLGLAIGRRLVSLLGGHIEMTSEQGVGTRVTVDLDLPVVAGDVSDAPDERVRYVGKSRPLDVLVAEDNAINRELIVAQLQRLGHRQTIVEDGEEALAALMSREFDVLLTDLQMPRRDGYALARAIRESDDALHIVAMTANALPEERARCLANGMDGFVAKPVRLDALREVLAGVTARDAVWDLDVLREDFGTLQALPAMVERFASAMHADIDGAASLHTSLEAQAWSHRVSGGLRVFGPSRAAAMLERLERDLLGADGNLALARLPTMVVALRTHVDRLVLAAQELDER
jgi:two-component system sensor histidine kinase EvgS